MSKQIIVTFERVIEETHHYTLEVPDDFPDTMVGHRDGDRKELLYRTIQDNGNKPEGFSVVRNYLNESHCTEAFVDCWFVRETT